jgi:hypothetical protein
VARKPVRHVAPRAPAEHHQHAVLRAAHNLLAVLEDGDREQFVFQLIALASEHVLAQIVRRQSPIAAGREQVVDARVRGEARDVVDVLFPLDDTAVLPRVPDLDAALVVAAHDHVVGQREQSVHRCTKRERYTETSETVHRIALEFSTD